MGVQRTYATITTKRIATVALSVLRLAGIAPRKNCSQDGLPVSRDQPKNTNIGDVYEVLFVRRGRIRLGTSAPPIASHL